MAKITKQEIDNALANLRVEGAALQYKQKCINNNHDLGENGKEEMRKIITKALIGLNNKGIMIDQYKQHLIEIGYFDV